MESLKAYYDVIIAGAGPAGLSCASVLAGSELSVLVLDKQEQIGPKACAGGLTRLANGFELPPGTFRSFNQQKVYQNGIPFRIRLDHPLNTISRTDLAAHQLGLLKDAPNISLQHPLRLLSVNKNRVVTDRGDVGFRYLVGADGSVSKVRKATGLPADYRAGLFVECPGHTKSFMWHVYPRKLGSAYFWTFPHLHHTNIGIYFDPGQLPVHEAREQLKKHLRRRKIDPEQLAIHGGVVNHLYRGWDFDPIFLAGDAAGLGIKSSGEGISSALISGSEVAHRIIDPTYAAPHMQQLLRIKHRQEKMLAIYESHPRWHNLLYTIFLLVLKNRKFQRWFGN